MATDPDRDKGRRRSVLEDALASSGTVYHAIRDEQDAS
jgi:hypothetical protein